MSKCTFLALKEKGAATATGLAAPFMELIQIVFRVCICFLRFFSLQTICPCSFFKFHLVYQTCMYFLKYVFASHTHVSPAESFPPRVTVTYRHTTGSTARKSSFSGPLQVPRAGGGGGEGQGSNVKGLKAVNAPTGPDTCHTCGR